MGSIERKGNYGVMRREWSPLFLESDWSLSPADELYVFTVKAALIELRSVSYIDS